MIILRFMFLFSYIYCLLNIYIYILFLSQFCFCYYHVKQKQQINKYININIMLFSLVCFVLRRFVVFVAVLTIFFGLPQFFVLFVSCLSSSSLSLSPPGRAGARGCGSPQGRAAGTE